MVKTCCVPSCRQESYRGCGLSFHLFPTDPKLKQAWLKALNRVRASKTTVVCSRHFKFDDYIGPYTSKLKPSVVPFLEPIDLDKEVTVSKICRVCLSSDVKMYEINEFNLKEMYESITGIADEDQKHSIYQYLCWECAARLSAASTFRDKALLADALLQGLLENGADLVKAKHLKTIKDNYNNLNSNLAVERVYNSVDHYKELTSKRNIKIEYVDHEKIQANIEELNDIEATPPKEHRNTKASVKIKKGHIETINSLNDDDDVSDNDSEFYEYEFLEDEQATALDYINLNNNKKQTNEKRDLNTNDTNMTCIKIEEEGSIKIETDYSEEENLYNDNTFGDNSDNYEDDDDVIGKTYLTVDNYSLTDDETELDNYDMKVEKLEIVEDDLFSEPLNTLHPHLGDDSYGVVEYNIKHDHTTANNTKTVIKHKTNTKNVIVIDKGNIKNAKKNIVNKTKKVMNDKKKLLITLNQRGDNITEEYIKSVKFQIGILNNSTDAKRRNDPDIDLSLFTVSRRSYDEQIQDIEKRKDTAQYKEAPYRCDVCHLHYYKVRALDVHKERHTDVWGKFECFICKLRHKNRKGLHQHLTDKHVIYYKCNKCSFGTMLRSALRRHVEYHNGMKFECPHCDQVFTKSTTYMGHLRLKHLCDFVCEICGYMFLSKHGVATHKCLKHASEINKKLEGPYCDVCQVTFASQEAHDRHLRLSPKHIYESDPNRLRNEYKNKPGKVVERPYAEYERPAKKCEYCNKRLPNRRYYGQHIRRLHPDIHRAKMLANKGRKTKYQPDNMCEHCGKLFASKVYLRDHMWVHTGVKFYKCDKCPKSFSTKQALKSHVLYQHQGVKGNAVCPVCGKTLLHHSNLKKHLFSHTGLKPHSCSVCNKKFAWSHELRSHVNHVHLNKPWPKRVRQRRKAPKKPEGETEE